METTIEKTLEETNTQTTNRRLASVQVVSEIRVHTNADSLALAQVLGWQVVIKKEECKVGEKIIYFEIDSLLPEKEWSEFLRAKNFRIKTIKLRGEISQGLILPLKILGEEINEDDYQVDQDLTEIIGVKKYEYDADLPCVVTSGGKKIKTSTYPTELLEKSDEPRIQSSPKLLNTFTGKPYVATLKYDGTSSTYLMDPNNPEEMLICSRNLIREYCPEEVYSAMADKYKIKEKLIELGGRYAIQGESYGPKISKNYLEVKQVQFAVFNARDMVEKRYLDFEELQDLCKKMDLPMVEVIDKGDCFNYTIDDLKKLCKGTYPNTKNPREGLVFRLLKDWHPEHTRYSFKIINEDFLIKHEGK